MIEEVKQLVDQYVLWLKDKIQLKSLDKAVEITTPYLDRHNDYMQIYVIKSPEGIILTDDSYTIRDLRTSGCTLDSPKRKELLGQILNGFGVQLSNTESLFVKVTPENFAIKKHNLLQGMLAVNDLFALSTASVTSLFLEDVAIWLKTSKVRCSTNIKIAGKSGYDHRFDFLIPASQQAPERILQSINQPTRDKAESLVFSWIDIRDIRGEEMKVYAILNDRDAKLNPGVLEALSTYEINPVLWSERDRIVEELVA